MENKIYVKIKTLEEVLKIEGKTSYLDVSSPGINGAMKRLFGNTYYTSATGRGWYTINGWIFKKEWIDIKETNYNITIKI